MEIPILKFLSKAEQEALRTKLEVGDGDIAFFAAGGGKAPVMAPRAEFVWESRDTFGKSVDNCAIQKTGNFLWSYRFPSHAFRGRGRSLCSLPPSLYRTGPGRFTID